MDGSKHIPQDICTTGVHTTAQGQGHPGACWAWQCHLLHPGSSQSFLLSTILRTLCALKSP